MLFPAATANVIPASTALQIASRMAPSEQFPAHLFHQSGLMLTTITSFDGSVVLAKTGDVIDAAHDGRGGPVTGAIEDFYWHDLRGGCDPDDANVVVADRSHGSSHMATVAMVVVGWASCHAVLATRSVNVCG